MFMFFLPLHRMFSKFWVRDENARIKEFNKRLNQLKKLLSESESVRNEKKSANSLKLSDFSYALSRIEDFDKKPIWKRWWLKITGEAEVISNDRLWLASQICLPFMKCNDLKDSNFKISKRYLKVFPNNWKKVLSKLVFCFNEGPIQKIVPAAIVNGLLIASHSENVWPKDSSSLINSKLYDLKARNEKRKETENIKLKKFLFACSFFGLDCKKVTSNLILEELHTLSLKFFRENIIKGYTNEDGVWIAFSPTILDEMVSSCKKLIDAVKLNFKDIDFNDQAIDYYSLSISSQEKQEALKSGAMARKEFDLSSQKILSIIPQDKMKLHLLNQEIADLRVQREILIRPEGVEEPSEEDQLQPGLRACI
jgi:hypothetical protein